jgi:antitoxin Xre/MbcA/ParS-like protein
MAAPKSSATRRRRALKPASPVKIVGDYGLTKKQLAETIGLAPEALYKRERLGAAKTQSRLREMNEILTRVEAWAGGPAQAMAWYRAEPIPAFGGRTAEALIKSGQAGPLRDYLDSIALGGFA